MFSLRYLLKAFLHPEPYIWADVLLIKETKKALLVEFDGKTAWLPKAWILKIRPPSPSCHCDPPKVFGGEAISSQSGPNKPIFLKISLYRWSQKFD